MIPHPSAGKTLVLGLGNELIADDAIGILAARQLRRTMGAGVDVCESSLHGLALLDVFLDYDRALIIDAMQTGRYPPGTIVELKADDLRPVDVPSPHFAGLPELVELARSLGLAFPSRIRILAVEVRDTATVGGAMTPEVRAAVSPVCDRALGMLDEF